MQEEPTWVKYLISAITPQGTELCVQQVQWVTPHGWSKGEEILAEVRNATPNTEVGAVMTVVMVVVVSPTMKKSRTMYKEAASIPQGVPCTPQGGIQGGPLGFPQTKKNGVHPASLG